MNEQPRRLRHLQFHGLYIGQLDLQRHRSGFWPKCPDSNGAGRCRKRRFGLPTVTYPLPDTSPPHLLITNPPDHIWATNAASLSVSGSASDDTGVIGVSWLSDRGTGSCTIVQLPLQIIFSCNIPLLSGLNTLTVAAVDASGNSGSDTLWVTATIISPPVISGVRSSPGAVGNATIEWTTDVPSDSQVVVGTLPGSGTPFGDSLMTTSHSVSLSGLASNITYRYYIRAKTSLDNLATTKEFTFTTFSVPNLGGVSHRSFGSGGYLVTGYGRIRPGTGSTTPSGVAIFGFRQGGVLASEAGVPDSPLISSGRTYAEVSSGEIVNTGLAFVNPNTATSRVFFDLRDRNGNIVGAVSKTLHQASIQQRSWIRTRT